MSLKVCSLVLSASPNWFYAARTMELQPGPIAVRPVNQEGKRGSGDLKKMWFSFHGHTGHSTVISEIKDFKEKLF